MTIYPDSQHRKQILSLLIEHPGLSPIKVGQLLSIRESVVHKCLHSLEEDGFVRSRPVNGMCCYYVRKKRKGSRERRTQEIRNNISNLLMQNPGLNLSTIADHLEMSAQLAEYHLLNMEKNNRIMGVKEQGAYYRRYYLKDSDVGARDKKILAILRQEHLLRIVLLILKYPNISHKALSELCDITPSTLTHHIIRLDQHDLLDIGTYGREKGYKIKNKKEIVWIIRKYIFDLVTESFTDVWDDLYIK